MLKFIMFTDLNPKEFDKLVASFDAGAYWLSFGFLVRIYGKHGVVRIDSEKEGGLA